MKTQFISLLIALLAGLLPLQAQQVSISGIVTDKKLNEPIIGASVVVKGTSNGCITDLDGNFQLNNVASGSTLVFLHRLSNPGNPRTKRKDFLSGHFVGRYSDTR